MTQMTAIALSAQTVLHFNKSQSQQMRSAFPENRNYIRKCHSLKLGYARELLHNFLFFKISHSAVRTYFFALNNSASGK